jgi:hypothetical protein
VRPGRVLGWSAALGLLAGAGIGCGFGDTLVTGLGNGGNNFYARELSDELADHLAQNEAIPTVTDEMLAEAFASIVARAQEGDAEASLILFRVAERQRAGDEE